LSAVFNRTVIDWFEVDFTDWGARDAHMFNVLKTAILERRIVIFDYFGANGEKTHRRAEPMQLRFKSKAWYLKAFCHIRQNMRLFKLTRITDLIITHELFNERDIETVPANVNPIESKKLKEEVNIRLKIAPEMTYRVLDEFFDAKRQPDRQLYCTSAMV